MPTGERRGLTKKYGHAGPAVQRFHQGGAGVCGALGAVRSYSLCPGVDLAIGNFAARETIDQRAGFVRREFGSIGACVRSRWNVHPFAHSSGSRVGAPG